MARFIIKLNNRYGLTLPLDYGFLVHGWIYSTMGKVDARLTRHLHDSEGIKPFCFGKLMPNKYSIDTKKQLIKFESTRSKIEISFYNNEIEEVFVRGVYNNDFLKNDFSIVEVERKTQIFKSNTARFRTISPIFVSILGRKYAQHLSPDSEIYSEEIKKNLIAKSGFDGDEPFEFKLLSKPKAQLRTFKTTKRKCYLFDFELTASTEFLEAGYYNGFGSGNSTGLGLCKIL